MTVIALDAAHTADYIESPLRRALRRLVRRRGAMVGLAVIVLFTLLAVFAAGDLAL